MDKHMKNSAENTKLMQDIHKSTQEHYKTNQYLTKTLVELQKEKVKNTPDPNITHQRQIFFEELQRGTAFSPLQTVLRL